MKVLISGFSLDSFFERLKKSKRNVLFLDYDGTLAPFRKERDKAVPYPGIQKTLESLLKIEKTRLVIISGRWTKDLIPLLGLKELPEIWGSHGWEHLKADGTYELAKLKDSAANGLAAADKWAKANNIETQFERKPVSRAVHWRGLDELEIKKLSNKVLRDWGPFTQGTDLYLHEFDGGIELRAKGKDKGHAVQAVLAQENKGVVSAYLGDDLTDEDAFSVLKDRGLSVLVRNELHNTLADLWLKPPEDLLEFLTKWVIAGK